MSVYNIFSGLLQEIKQATCILILVEEKGKVFFLSLFVARVTFHHRHCAAYPSLYLLQHAPRYNDYCRSSNRCHCFAKASSPTETRPRSWCCCCWSMSRKPNTHHLHDTRKAMLIRLQMDCWNEAAGVAKCDPNKDDKCLCGPFLNAVTSCTAATCSISENLGMSSP